MLLSSLNIFFMFTRFSLVSFGGLLSILPEIERCLVVENHWLTHQEFMQYYVMAQLAPGPNMVVCSMIGYKLCGLFGLLAAFLGIYGPAFLIVSIVFLFFQKLRKYPIVSKLELSLRPAILGLTVGSFAKIGFDLFSQL